MMNINRLMSNIRRKSSQITSRSYTSIAEHGKLKSSDMVTLSVMAPAYFGESCLWVPIEEWGREPRLRHEYNARCEMRCELVYWTHESVQDLIATFPWLGVRLRDFREYVLEIMAPVVVFGEEPAPRARAPKQPAPSAVAPQELAPFAAAPQERLAAPPASAAD